MRTALLAPFSVLLGCFSPSALDLEGAPATGAADVSTTDAPADTTSGTTDAPPPGEGSTTAEPTAGPTGESPSTTGADGCDPGHACVAGAPAGWAGPGLLHEDGETPCTGVFSVEGARGATVVDAPAAACGCSCAPDAAATCSSVTVTGFNDTTCGSGGSVYNFVDGDGCRSTGVNASVQAEPAEIDSGFGCDPVPETQLSEASLSEPRILCLPEGLEASCRESSTCLEQTPQARYCIAHPGDVPCPADAGYPERTVLGDTVQDTRACGRCTCGPQEGSCATVLWEWGGSNCNGGPPVAIVADGSCVETGLPSATVTIGPSQGACVPSAGAPQGEATLVPATTVCCGVFR